MNWITQKSRVNKTKQGIPDNLFDHPIFLMNSLLKLSKRQDNGNLYLVSKSRPSLSLQHYVAIVFLEAHGPMSQQELSKKMRIDPSDLVSILDALEANKYIVRSADKQDRRRYILSLTDRGDMQLPGFLIRARKFHKEFFSPLSDKEQAQLCKLLLKTINYHHTNE